VLLRPACRRHKLRVWLQRYVLVRARQCQQLHTSERHRVPAAARQREWGPGAPMQCLLAMKYLGGVFDTQLLRLPRDSRAGHARMAGLTLCQHDEQEAAAPYLFSYLSRWALQRVCPERCAGMCQHDEQEAAAPYLFSYLSRWALQRVCPERCAGMQVLQRRCSSAELALLRIHGRRSCMLDVGRCEPQSQTYFHEKSLQSGYYASAWFNQIGRKMVEMPE